jgi:hypothetical protein
MGQNKYRDAVWTKYPEAKLANHMEHTSREWHYIQCGHLMLGQGGTRYGAWRNTCDRLGIKCPRMYKGKIVKSELVDNPVKT